MIDCNESISGFFCLPVADWVFGTCLMPRSIYSDGEDWTPEEFVSPRPVWPIRMLDRAADRSVQGHRAGTDAASEQPGAPRSRQGERIAIWVTNGLGLAASLLAFALLVVSASLYGDAWHVVSFSVFGLTLFLLNAIYALYYVWRTEEGKRFFLKLGRASAFLLIAGTYTPFLLVSLRGPWGWALFGVVWGLCIAGAVFQFVVGNRYRLTSTLATLFVGWMVVVAIKPLVAVVPHGGPLAAPCRRAMLHGGRGSGLDQEPALQHRRHQHPCPGRKHLPPPCGAPLRPAPAHLTGLCVGR